MRVMRTLTKGDMKTAFNNVRRNKARSGLTMLGIIIGVASVVTAVSIGEGVKHEVNAQTIHLGKDLITIRPGRLLTQRSANPLDSLSLPGSLRTGGSLSGDDIDTVAKTPGVAHAVPLSVVSSDVVSGETNQHYGALVIGTDQGLPAILNQSLSFGAFFSDDPSDLNKVILGSRVANELFSENVPLGQTLSILGHQFIVSGIFNDFQTAPLAVDADFNNAVFIQYASAKQITNNNSPIYEILARPVGTSQTDATVSSLRSSLLAAHGGQHDFTVLEQSQTLAVTNSILDLLTALVTGVAAISLLVGGVGIMNITLVSVTERMHEIGIRKAVGATNGQILSQFIIEAAVLSVSGGVIGVLLAGFVDVSLGVFTSFVPVMTWQSVVLASLVSIGVGMIFGSVPALKAARKDPIEALRNE